MELFAQKDILPIQIFNHIYSPPGKKIKEKDVLRKNFAYIL